MAWNRPTESGEAVSRPLQKRKGFRFPIRGAITGAIVVVGAVVAAWWLWPSEEARQDAASEKRTLIKEVAPAKAAKATTAPEKKKDPPGYWNGAKISETNRPPWMSPYHRVVDYGHSITAKVSEAMLTRSERVFDHPIDQAIGMLIDVEPGTYFLGDGEGLYDDFDRYFVESLKEPIIVRQDDPEDVKALKRAVIETKADLKARMDKGESIQRIMEETRKEYRELGLFKQELEEQINELCEKDSVTEQDADDCVKAANRMLEDRGCTPFADDSFFRQSLLLRVSNRRRANNGAGTSE